MHREQRHLHCEGQGEGQEQPAGRVGGQKLIGGDSHQIEGDITATAGGVQERQSHDGHQHQGRAEHGEQEELDGRVGPPPVAPTADQEVHGHQHDLEEDEEHDQVEGHERAQAARLQHQHPGVVGLGRVLGVHADDGQREDESGHHHQEQRQPVHADLPRDAPARDPLVLLPELEDGRRAGVELGEHPHRQYRGHRRGHQGDRLEQVWSGTGHRQQHQGPCHRDQHQHGQSGREGR